MRLTRAVILVGLFGLHAGCGGEKEETPPSDNTQTDTTTTTSKQCGAVPVTCVDAHISALDLLTAPNTGTLSSTALASGVRETTLDAQAGGLTPNQSYFYARFTADGLEKVALDDQAALASTDWDIAFRRYVIRVNSGVSGPSCVKVARTEPGTDLQAMTSLPNGLVFHTEKYFTDSCDLVPDGTGLGAPATVLSSYWTYQSCVQMTGNVYVMQLRDGRYVKLQVASYYAPDKQTVCDSTGSVPQPSGAAVFRLHCAFLP